MKETGAMTEKRPNTICQDKMFLPKKQTIRKEYKLDIINNSYPPLTCWVRAKNDLSFSLRERQTSRQKDRLREG